MQNRATARLFKGPDTKSNANIQKDSNCQTTIIVLLLPTRLRHVFYLRRIHLALISYRHGCECGAINNYVSYDSCSCNAFKQLHAANDCHSLAIADLATPCLLHIHFALVSQIHGCECKAINNPQTSSEKLKDYQFPARLTYQICHYCAAKLANKSELKVCLNDRFFVEARNSTSARKSAEFKIPHSPLPGFFINHAWFDYIQGGAVTVRVIIKVKCSNRWCNFRQSIKRRRHLLKKKLMKLRGHQFDFSSWQSSLLESFILRAQEFMV